jgi:glycosyltransferase involved in cell wall biosynthesis
VAPIDEREDEMRHTAAADGQSIELSIIMPCLNEAETLGTCIKKASAFLKRSGINGEIVIGDNGSTDGSQKIAIDSGARVINVPFRGYGAALFGASKAARGRWIIMGDSDDSYDFLNLEPFIEKLREGYELVMGNRFKGGILEGAMPWKNRYIGNPALSGIANLLFRSPIGDFHCGIRGYSKDAFERMDLRTTGMEFASEMVIKANLMKLKITEVPTILKKDGRSRPPHLLPFRDGLRHLRFMLLYSPNWLFFYPGCLLMALGILAGGALLAGSVRIVSVTFSTNTLIYCAFMVAIGFQSILFSMLSRVYAIQQGLYPAGVSDGWLYRNLRLTRILAVGLAITAIGVALLGAALVEWKSHSFGELDFLTISRLTIPSATTLMIGIEMSLFSFFFSTMMMGVNYYEFLVVTEFVENNATCEAPGTCASGRAILKSRQL